MESEKLGTRQAAWSSRGKRVLKRFIERITNIRDILTDSGNRHCIAYKEGNDLEHVCAMKQQIAIVHGPLVVGGAEKALINMLRFFDYSRYDVTLWLKDNTGLMEPQVDPRVVIRYWGEYLDQDYREYITTLLKHGRLHTVIQSVRYRILSRKHVQNWHKNYKYYIKSLPLLSDTEYDVAISYHSLVREDLMILDYALKAKKKIGWIHGVCRHDFHDPYFESFPIEYKRLDHVFCVSEAIREIFLDKYPELKTKTSVMYNLQQFDEIRRLSKEQIQEPFDGVTLVSVGRLSEEKGQTMIPEITRKLLDKGYRFIWYVVGEGQTRQFIEEEISKWDVEDTVLLLGNRLNPYPYIRKATLFILPSFSEGFCVTTFEAKILGTPVVTTDVPGIHEQFSQGEAVICKATPESITDGICFALSEIDSLKHRSDAVFDGYNEKELKKLYWVIEA